MQHWVRPLLIVVVDDLRFDDFGAAGHPFARTPNLDRLAREGAQFKNFFAVTPLCSPSRANILTGLNTRHHGILDNTERSARSHELQTFARALHDTGYNTGFVGQWHMGNDPTKGAGAGQRRSGIGQLAPEGFGKEALLEAGSRARTLLRSVRAS
ncbi:MAG: sulfatase-like hydrolase/transferase [Vicinamibacteria bacterium]|nr:sulfatase-like hydrolase/transferase [Vicinamibacteria bacterium]